MSSINNSKKQIICPHNHRKYTCKECGGSSICEKRPSYLPVFYRCPDLPMP